jgi:glycine/D-amino acid oxidase-like deaminating enzyme
VVVAAGPWTPEALCADPAWRPVGPMWGVVALVRLPDPPRHALEHADVEGITTPGGSPDVMFTLIPAADAPTLGSTFARAEPDPRSVAPRLIAHGTRYVPALRDAAIESVRACARPLSADGRALLGPVPGVDGLHLLTGHGPWGVTLGPGSARLVADGVLGRPAAIPAELRADRFGTPFADRRAP